MNIPNALTLARIILVPLIVWLIITHEIAAAFVLFDRRGFAGQDLVTLGQHANHKLETRTSGIAPEADLTGRRGDVSD